MPKPRIIDYEEAKSLRAGGCTYSEIAAVYGVSASAVRQAVDERARARRLAYSAQWQRRGLCPDCGAQSTSHRADRSDSTRCRACASALATTTVKPGAIRCLTCKTWKADDAFPFNRSKKGRVRRGRHQSCRACLTVLRREYRERNKIPCATCGTLVLHERRDKMKQPECRSCANRRTQLARSKDAR